MTNRRDQLLFLPLGGAGEIGMNLNLYGYNGKWLMVDLGITFADETLPGIDIIVPDPAWIVDRRKDLLGLIITHAHEDHLGAVPYLWRQLRCPIWATGFAASVLRKKLADHGIDNVPITVFEPGETIELGPFKATAISITHSIPESQALAIETPQGLILHTGDWKLDPQPMLGPVTDGNALSRFGDAGVLAMIGDSTNVFTPGTSGSEASVKQGLLKAIDGKTGRVAITTFASNVARLQTIAEVGAESGRHVCLVGRSLWRFFEAARENGYLANMPAFVDEEDTGFLPAEKILYICTGCQGEPRGAMARIASGTHRNIALGRGDTVIFSSKIIPGNERTLYQLHNELASAGVEVITEKDAPVHVSGHPCRDELAEMYRMVRPQIAVPVHGEARHLIAHAKLARSLGVKQTMVLKNGQMMRLAPGPIDIVEEVPAGRLAVDGPNLVTPQDKLLQSRRRLQHNGAAMVSLVLDQDGRLLAPPMVACHGIGAEVADLNESAQAAVETAIDRMPARIARDDEAVREAARVAVRKTVRQFLERRPIIEVQLTRLDSATVKPQRSKEGVPA